MDTVYTTPFLLIRQDGHVIEYGDGLTLARAVRGFDILAYHVLYHSNYNGRLSTTTREWIVRDDWGVPLTQTEIDRFLPRWTPRRLRNGYDSRQQHAASLGLPIPGTGRHSGGHYFRRPHCLRALRAHAAMGADDAMIRLKGIIKRPPNNWDDLGRADRDDRNWKRHRQTQWK